MIPIERVGLLLLAAGLSRRFGIENKLIHPLAGQPLVQHTADIYSSIGFQNRVAVCPPDEDGPRVLLAASGFGIVENHSAAAGQSSSIILGVKALLERPPLAVMIALADMPFVTGSHVQNLIDQVDVSDAGVAASVRDDGSISPPAIFRAKHFDALLHLAGDRGARDLLKTADLVAALDTELADFDTRDDFERWQGVDNQGL